MLLRIIMIFLLAMKLLGVFLRIPMLIQRKWCVIKPLSGDFQFHRFRQLRGIECLQCAVYSQVFFYFSIPHPTFTKCDLCYPYTFNITMRTDWLQGSVQTTLEKFESGVFILETLQMFSVHTKPEKFENAKITGGKNLEGTLVLKMFSVHT